MTLSPNEIGSCGRTCRRACWLNLAAHPAQDESDVSLRICSRDTNAHLLSLINVGGEDRNRTCPGSCEPTTVLKTARTTRHPSLSGENANRGLRIANRKEKASDYLSFLIAL